MFGNAPKPTYLFSDNPFCLANVFDCFSRTFRFYCIFQERFGWCVFNAVDLYKNSGRFRISGKLKNLVKV